MKTLRRYFPVLILILALIILFAPARNNNAGIGPTPPLTQAADSSVADTVPDAGDELQLLEPAQDTGIQTASADDAEEITIEETAASFGDAQSGMFFGRMNWGGMQRRDTFAGGRFGEGSHQPKEEKEIGEIQKNFSPTPFLSDSDSYY